MSILSYIKTVWVDKVTAVGPLNLNNMEDGIEDNNTGLIDLDQSNKYVLLTYISAGLFAADTVIAFDDKKEILIELEATELDPTTPVKISVDNQVTEYLVKVGDVLNSLLVSDGQGNKFTLHRDGSIALIPKEEPSKTDEIEYDLPIQSEQTIVPVEGSPFGDNKIEGESAIQAANYGDIRLESVTPGLGENIGLGANIVTFSWATGEQTITLSNIGTTSANHTYFKDNIFEDIEVSIKEYYIIVDAENNEVDAQTLRVGRGYHSTFEKSYAPGERAPMSYKGIMADASIATNRTHLTIGVNATQKSFTIYKVMVIPLLSVKQLAMTLSELNAKYPIYFESLKSVENPEIKVRNLNLFNKDTATNDRFVNVASGALSTDDRFYASDFIKLIPGTLYILSDHAASGAAGNAFYDEQFNFISAVTTQAFTMPTNATYARVSFRKTTQDIETAQLEEGSSVSSFIAHDNSSKKYPNQILRDVPDGTADYIDTKNNILHTLTKKYILTEDDITALDNTTFTNDFATVAAGVLAGVVDFTDGIDGFLRVVGSFEMRNTGDDYNDVSLAGAFATLSGGQISMTSLAGTWADLAAAKTALAGTIIIYKLAEEVIIENIKFDGIAFAYKNMTVELIQDNGFGFSVFAKHAQNDSETIKLLGQELEKTQKELDIYTNLKPVYQFDTDDSTTIDLSVLPKGTYNIECERKAGASTSRNIVATGYVGRALTPSGSASGQTDLIIPQNNCSDDETSDRYISRLLVNETTHFGDTVQISANGTNVINRQVRKADLLIESLPVGYIVKISKL